MKKLTTIILTALLHSGSVLAQESPNHQLVFTEHSRYTLMGTFDGIPISPFGTGPDGWMIYDGRIFITERYIQWAEPDGSGNVNVLGQFGEVSRKTYASSDTSPMPGLPIYANGFTVIGGAVDRDDSVPIDVTFIDLADQSVPESNATGILLLLPLAAMLGAKQYVTVKKHQSGFAPI